MLVHSVFFWLKPGLTPEEEGKFREGLESLRGIASVDGLYIGTPAPTERPVIDRTYSYGLTVILKDMEAHDAYQIDPTHKTFVANCSQYWERVLIYDAM